MGASSSIQHPIFFFFFLRFFPCPCEHINYTASSKKEEKNNIKPAIAIPRGTHTSETEGAECTPRTHGAGRSRREQKNPEGEQTLIKRPAFLQFTFFPSLSLPRSLQKKKKTYPSYAHPPLSQWSGTFFSVPLRSGERVEKPRKKSKKNFLKRELAVRNWTSGLRAAHNSSFSYLILHNFTKKKNTPASRQNTIAPNISSDSSFPLIYVIENRIK